MLPLGFSSLYLYLGDLELRGEHPPGLKSADRRTTPARRGVLAVNNHRQHDGARTPPAPPISMLTYTRRPRFAAVGVSFETIRTPRIERPQH